MGLSMVDTSRTARSIRTVPEPLAGLGLDVGKAAQF